MKKFWNVIGKGLAKLAVWAVEHPDQLITVINTAKVVKKK